MTFESSVLILIILSPLETCLFLYLFLEKIALSVIRLLHPLPLFCLRFYLQERFFYITIIITLEYNNAGV